MDYNFIAQNNTTPLNENEWLSVYSEHMEFNIFRFLIPLKNNVGNLESIFLYLLIQYFYVTNFTNSKSIQYAKLANRLQI